MVSLGGNVSTLGLYAAIDAVTSTPIECSQIALEYPLSVLLSPPRARPPRRTPLPTCRTQRGSRHYRGAHRTAALLPDPPSPHPLRPPQAGVGRQATGDI